MIDYVSAGWAIYEVRLSKSQGSGPSLRPYSDGVFLPEGLSDPGARAPCSAFHLLSTLNLVWMADVRQCQYHLLLPACSSPASPTSSVRTVPELGHIRIQLPVPRPHMPFPISRIEALSGSESHPHFSCKITRLLNKRKTWESFSFPTCLPLRFLIEVVLNLYFN